MRTVEVKNLLFGYEENKPILKDVSFCLEKGSYTCLLGHNGSGKSTLAKVLMGLNPRFSGEVNLFEMSLNSKNLGKIRSKVGIVFQNPDNQFVGSSVADDIAFGLENTNVPQDKMQGIIEGYAKKVGMEDYLDSSPENLSGGQKQRVAIAGVLAMHTDLIIFDEATSMLDPKGKREILSIIHEMKKENPNLTILSITHDVEEALNADNIIVLNSGEIVLEGKPEEVFEKEETLRSIHLGLPFYYELRNALVKEGVDIPSSIKNLDMLEEYLCK